MNLAWLSFLFGLPAVLIAIGAIAGGTFTGFLYLAGVFGKAKVDNFKDAEKANQYVITALQQKIGILEKDMTDMGTRLDTLQVENKTFRDVLTGRDPQTILFQQQGFEAMKAVPEILDLTRNTNKNIERLFDLIEKHLNLMEAQQATVTTTLNTQGQQTSGTISSGNQNGTA